MIDAKVEKTNGRFDIVVENGTIAKTGGFDTSIFLSLFTDARASESEVPLPQARRGWIGNIASPVENRQLGGKMWLVDQRRLTQLTLNETIDRARKSLAWFIEDGIAKELEVTGSIIPRKGISLEIIITSFNGATETHYVPLWELTGE